MNNFFSNLGFFTAAEGTRGKKRVPFGKFLDIRLEGVQILYLETDMIWTWPFDRHAGEFFDAPRHDGQRHLPVGEVVAFVALLAVDGLQLEHVGIKLGDFFRVRRADRVPVGMARLAAAVIFIGVILVDAVQVLRVFLRKIENIAVGIVAAIGGEGTPRRTFDDVGTRVRRFHAVLGPLDAIDDHTEMVEPAHIAVAVGQKIKADPAIARGATEYKLSPVVFGCLQTEQRLIVPLQQRILLADHGDVVDLREHAMPHF